MATTTTTLAEQVEALTRRVEELERRLASEPELPEDCRAHRCSYYTHYLAYGGPELTHEGYHSAEKLGGEHIRNCAVWERGRSCGICRDWEARVRA